MVGERHAPRGEELPNEVQHPLLEALWPFVEEVGPFWPLKERALLVPWQPFKAEVVGCHWHCLPGLARRPEHLQRLLRDVA